MPSLLDLTPTAPVDIYSMISEISTQHGVDPDLVRGVVQVESGFNPTATSSTSSAKGLMQLVDGTAKMMGVQDPYNPRQNLEGGIKYLKQQLDASGGDISKALAMYNQGPAGDLNKARDYVAKVRSNYKGKSWGIAPAAALSTSGRSLYDLGGEVPTEEIPLVQSTQTASSDEDQAWPVATHIIDYIHRNLPRYKEGWEQAKTATDRPFMPGFDEFVQRAGDLALGTVEAPLGLASGAVGFFTGVGASAPKAVSSFAHPGGVWAGLSEAKDTLDKVSEGFMWQPSTKTGRAPLEAISGMFGEAHNFIADTWKEHFAEGLSPEELDKRIKGTQYLFDVATLGLGLGKEKVKGKTSEIKWPGLDPDTRPEVNTPEGVTPADVAPVASHEVSPIEVASFVEQIPDVPKEAVDIIKMVADKATKEKIKKEKAEKVVEPQVEGVSQTMKIPSNKKIVRSEREVVAKDGLNSVEERIEQKTKALNTELDKGDLRSESYINALLASLDGEVARHRKLTEELENAKKERLENIETAPVEQPAVVEPPTQITETIAKPEIKSAEVSEGITLPTVEQLDAIEPKATVAEVKLPYISEFDSTILAKDEGYTFPVKKRYASVEEAQAKATSMGEGHEVVKIGEKYRVAKFTETEILPFDSPEAVSAAGWDMMSEISERQAKSETPSEGFAIGKVGDSYYRLSKHEEMPRDAMMEALDAETGRSLEDYGFDEDGVTAEDWAALKEFDRDGTLSRTLSEQKTALDQLAAQMRELDVHPQAKADRVPELMEAYEKWKEGWVTKSNAETSISVDSIISKLTTVTTLTDALNTIKSSLDPVRKHIVDKILDNIGDVEFKLASTVEESADLGVRPNGELRAAGAHQYSRGNNYSKVTIANKNLSVTNDIITSESILSTILHEAVHAATVRKINKGIKDTKEGNWTPERSFYNDINQLTYILKDVRIPSNIKDTGVSGALNRAKEFIAEGLSNPVFIDFLKSIKTPPSNVHSKFVNLIRDILGIPIKESNVFIDLLNLTDKILPSKSKPIKSENLGIIDPSFTPHDTFEAAQKFKEDLGLEGDVIGPDPKTGKYYIYDSMADLDSVHWEREVLDGDVDSVVEQYERADTWSEPEASESGKMNIWDILSNERGSVELPQYDLQTLRNLRTHLGRLEAAAESLGVNIATYLKDKFDLDGVTLQNTLALLKARQDGSIDRRIRELDPIVEGIFNPNSPTVSQKVKTSKKGYITKEVPFTEEMRAIVKNSKDNSWKGKILGRYMVATEIALGQFKRYGLENIFWKWADQEKARVNWLKERQIEMKGWLKPFSKKEIHDMSVFSMALQPGVAEMFVAKGVEIPKMSPQQLEVLGKFRALYDQIYDHVNYNRVNMGLAPMKKVNNYFTIQRAIADMRERGTYESFRPSPVAFAEATREFKAKFNQYVLDRAKNSKLDIKFDLEGNHLKYLDTMSQEMFTAPVAAYAHKLATGKWKEQMGTYKNGKPRFKSWSMKEVTPDLYKILTRWASNVQGINPAANVYKMYSWLGPTENYLREAIIYSTIIGKTSTMVKQVGSLVGTYSQTGLPYTLHGIARAMGERSYGLLKNKVTRAREKSSILTVRNADIFIEQLADMWATGKLSSTRRNVANVLSIPLQAIDAFIAEASWNAFYDHARTIGKMNEAEAIRWADDRVVYTQSVGKKAAVSPIQNAPIFGIVTLLQNFAITDFNFLTRDIIGIKNPDRFNLKHARQAMRYVIGGYLFNAMLQGLGMQADFPQPYEEYKKAEEEGKDRVAALGEASLEFLEKMPILGGSMKYESSLFGIAGQLGTDIPKSFGSAVELLDWDNMSEKQRLGNMLEVGKVLGASLKIPMTNQIVQSIRASANDAEPWEVVLGVYDRELQKQGKGGLPKLQGLPSLPKL